ncbi:uncharacterized protein LOC117177788 [Belonocnema kinseyi]|uniref:uncharacterized protein LOC117177788 n=1 Tax=Belonocnema kinseyi TaxID=2817044 RepID=UPI00143DE024|nr:uncharacterized protein LOC117177788 [Belonocnema kinseyi]
MEQNESHSIHNSVEKKNSEIINNGGAEMLKKIKNSNYITYTEEEYEKGLEMLNLPMKMLLDTLEYNPRIVFVKLNHIGENYFTNGSAYKTRNKSVVRFLSPRQVERKAIQDVNLMWNTIQKMILGSGKLITSGIQSVQTFNVTPTFLVNCKICKDKFSKRSDLVNHIENNHPDIPLQNCAFCGRKFLVLRGLAQHINMSHAMIMMENKGKENSLQMSESFPPFNTHSAGKGIYRDNVTSLKDPNNSGVARVEDISDQKEKVIDGSTCKYTSKYSNEMFFICNNESSSSLYSFGSSGNSNDSHKKEMTVDSVSLTCLNSENKSICNIPGVSSIIAKNKETENSLEFQVPLILPTDQQDIPKAVCKQENNHSTEPTDNLDFILSSEKKSTSVKHVDSSLDNGEPKNTGQENSLRELNSIQQNKADLGNLIVVDEPQKRALITKFEKQEMFPYSNQNYEKKTDTKAMELAVDDEVFSDKICCICLDIINVTRQIFDKKQYSKFKCHECPFCGVRYADIYFEHHVATVHLVCDENECKSRVILTASHLRELLNMEIKMECIHVNCNHDSSSDLKKSEDSSHYEKFQNDETINTVDDNLKDINVFVNNNNGTLRQEFDTTENNMKTCWKNLQDFVERKQEKVNTVSSECNASDLKFAIKVEPCNRIKEEDECYEDNLNVRSTDSSLPSVNTPICNTVKNKVSSNKGGYVDQISSQESRSDESSKVIKVESYESSFCCCICKETFQQEQKLLAHLFHYHRFCYPFTCDVCFLCYKNMEDLQVHVKMHGKHSFSEKAKCNTSDIVEGKDSLQKYCLLDKTAAFEFYVKEEPSQHLAHSTAEAQHLESVKPSLTKDPLTSKRSVVVDVRKELDLLKFNTAQEDNSFIKSNTLSSSVVVPNINCSREKIKLKSNDAAETLHIKNEQKDSPSKKKKLKIPCVVEKVEYPLDLHNLYAHSRKAQDPKVVNSNVALELDSNCTAECNNTFFLSVETKKKNNPVDSVSYLKDTTTVVRRKLSTSFSVSSKKMKKNDCQAHTDSASAAAADKVIFQCKTCEKTFDFKRSYSEHMFFMHDEIFDDSVVCDLLKPSFKSKNIENALQENTGYKLNNCTNEEFAQSVETSLTIDDTNTVMACSMHQGSLVNLEKNLTDGIINNNNARNCSQCGERYVQVTSYFQHRYDIHGDDSLVHVCENCSKVLITVNMVNSHLCTQVDTFSCKDCGLNFVNGLALKQHNTTTHFESIGPHVCHDCKKCFLTNRMLQKHKRILHSDGSRTGSSYSKKEDRKRSRLHESDGSSANTTDQFENTLINVDDESTPRKDRTVSLVRPLINKKGKINSLTCPVCKFVLQSIRRLQAHLMVNHSKVTDLCLLCNRLFAFGRGIRHMLDFHIIPACNKDNEYVLSWEGDPRKDVKEAIHVLGEKRLLAICSYDDYTTMTDSASFQCRHCSMTYSAVRFYRNHYVQRHDDFCALCGQSFQNNKDFTVHVENVHNSLKHYLWFTETIISTIIQTERSKENSLETFIQIIGRKLDENEVDAASQLLERMEVERISTNSTYLDKCHLIVANDAMTSQLPGSSFDLLEEAPIGLSSLSEDSQLPSKVRGVSIVTTSEQQLPVLPSELPTESFRADILQLPDFCMEYEITDNGTIVAQNSNYCNNEILVPGSIKDQKEYMEEGNIKERKQTINTIMSTRTFDISNCIFENSTSVAEDASLVDLKENQILTLIASCPTSSSSQASSSGHIVQVDSLEKGVGECSSSVAVGINSSNVNNEKVALVVTEEDLRIYKNDIQALAERLSITCNELSVDEIVETLQAYVISQI